MAGTCDIVWSGGAFDELVEIEITDPDEPVDDEPDDDELDDATHDG